MIGILDWGIGGIGFFQLLRARHPQAPVIYWSDSGVTPYGRLPAAALAARVGAVAAELGRRGVTHLAVACNAASSVLPLGRTGPVEVAGIIEPGIGAVRALSDPGLVGIIAGRRTILAGSYRRGLAGLRIKQRIAQPLSAYVEAGDLSSAALQTDLARIMRPLGPVDTLVLACTHYLALAPALQALAPRARLIDPAEALVAWVEAHWPLAGMPPREPEFLTTGDPEAMRRAARAAFGAELGLGIKRTSTSS